MYNNEENNDLPFNANNNSTLYSHVDSLGHSDTCPEHGVQKINKSLRNINF